ncbi:MAG: hypothetical protein M1831_005617 [Alyxoria varia]|nr:MAG: hypothetical protein M1831_005617 [Alyxoria varia]
MSTTLGKRQWPFAPLDPSMPNTKGKPQLQGIVFDVDGTLYPLIAILRLTANHKITSPHKTHESSHQLPFFPRHSLPSVPSYKSQKLNPPPTTTNREALSIPRTTDILEHINSLPASPTGSTNYIDITSPRESASNKIRAIERRAMARQRPQPGLEELMRWVDGTRLKKGICTRNFDEPVNHLLATFLPTPPFKPFTPILTRAFQPPKPHPAGILHIARTWGLLEPSPSAPGSDESAAIASPERLTTITADPASLATATTATKRDYDPREPPEQLPIIMVGDSADDMVAGKRAGATTVLLVNGENEHLLSAAAAAGSESESGEASEVDVGVTR